MIYFYQYFLAQSPTHYLSPSYFELWSEDWVEKGTSQNGTRERPQKLELDRAVSGLSGLGLLVLGPV